MGWSIPRVAECLPDCLVASLPEYLKSLNLAPQAAMEESSPFGGVEGKDEFMMTPTKR